MVTAANQRVEPLNPYTRVPKAEWDQLALFKALPDFIQKSSYTL